MKREGKKWIEHIRMRITKIDKTGIDWEVLAAEEQKKEAKNDAKKGRTGAAVHVRRRHCGRCVVAAGTSDDVTVHGTGYRLHQGDLFIVGQGWGFTGCATRNNTMSAILNLKLDQFFQFAII